MSRIALASLMSLLALAACNNGDQYGDPPVQNDASLERFSNCSALEVGLVNAYTEQIVSWRYGYWYWDVALEDAPSDADTNSDSGGDSPSDYSTTNNQEAGVDEPDMVKTNGNFIYVVDPSWYGTQSVHVVKSWPVEDAEEVATIELEGDPYSMFLNGNQLVVYQYIGELPSDGVRGYGWGTRISIIDVTDPANPEEVRQIDVEGYLNTARMIGTDVYSVVNTYSYMPDAINQLAWDESVGLPANDDYWNLSEAEQEALREEARRILKPKIAQIIQDLGVENLLPRKWDHLPGEVVDAEPLTACGDIYHPQGISAPSMLTVAHLGLDDPSGDLATTTVMADGWQVYASESALYVAQSSWWWWWGYGDLEQNTQIHKFDLEGADTTYVASGSIDGWINNQFSFSEYEGNLRVATSDFWWWGCWGACQDEEQPTPANNVFVLAQGGDDLNTIGEVRGIAPGEQIYSTRFLGDVGFMVTFMQTDPLFTLDLSDPTAPRVVGELVMPGYSSYLHPIEGDKLLAVGMAGTDDGQITGFKVSLFDVSDLANPTIADELTVETGDWSYSDALWDHHAFTFHRDNLSVPLYAYSWDEADDSYEQFSGLLSVDVDADAGTLSEVGRISHQDMVDASECIWDEFYTGYYGEDADTRGWSYCDENDYSWYWYATVRRSVVIEDNLFSISDYGLKATKLDDPSQVVSRVLFYPAE